MPLRTVAAERLERLERLDRELVADKRVDQLNAIHGGQTVRVTVERCHPVGRHWQGDRDYKASAMFNATEYVSFGILPSHAFIRVTRKLGFAIDRSNFETNMVGSVVPMPDRKAA